MHYHRLKHHIFTHATRVSLLYALSSLIFCYSLKYATFTCVTEYIFLSISLPVDFVISHLSCNYYVWLMFTVYLFYGLRKNIFPWEVNSILTHSNHNPLKWAANLNFVNALCLQSACWSLNSKNYVQCVLLCWYG